MRQRDIVTRACRTRADISRCATPYRGISYHCGTNAVDPDSDNVSTKK